MDGGVGDPVWLQDRDRLNINFKQPCQGLYGVDYRPTVSSPSPHEFSHETPWLWGLNNARYQRPDRHGPQTVTPSIAHQLIFPTAKSNSSIEACQYDRTLSCASCCAPAHSVPPVLPLTSRSRSVTLIMLAQPLSASYPGDRAV